MIVSNRPAHVVIDRSAMAHNLERVRELIPAAKVMAVIKADGYGHGMEIAADVLKNADEYGVSSLDDVHRLATLGLDKPFTLLSASLNSEDFIYCAEHGIRPTIYDRTQISELEAINSKQQLHIWLKVDTGMGRLGFSVKEIPEILDQLKACKFVSGISLMTHLSSADTPNDETSIEQLEAFATLAGLDEFEQLSALNSAGVIAFSHHDYQMVRPGIMLYGISPIPEMSAEEIGLKPAMNFRSSLISVKELPKGSTIGYGGSYQLEQDSRIGVVACGYGDGYPRHAPSGTPVVVNKQIAELVGRVSMDMLAVDLNGIEAKVGDVVELWGSNNPISHVASLASTIPYELTCSITSRVRRTIV